MIMRNIWYGTWWAIWIGFIIMLVVINQEHLSKLVFNLTFGLAISCSIGWALFGIYGNTKRLMLTIGYFNPKLMPVELLKSDGKIRYSLAYCWLNRRYACANFIVDYNNIQLYDDGTLFKSYSKYYTIYAWRPIRESDRVIQTLTYGVRPCQDMH